MTLVQRWAVARYCSSAATIQTEKRVAVATLLFRASSGSDSALENELSATATYFTCLL